VRSSPTAPPRKPMQAARVIRKMIIVRTVYAGSQSKGCASLLANSNYSWTQPKCLLPPQNLKPSNDYAYTNAEKDQPPKKKDEAPENPRRVWLLPDVDHAPYVDCNTPDPC
jgi:hypothetical protein